MVGFREALEAGVKSAACSVISPAGNAARLAGELIEETPIIGGPIALIPDAIAGLAGLVCDDLPTPEQQEPGLPYTGGQCPVQYNYVWTVRRIGNPGFETDEVSNSATSAGPFGSVESFTIANGHKGFRATNGLGGFIQSSTYGEIAYSDVEFVSLELSRVDGLADDCGNAGEPPPLTDSEREVTQPVVINNNPVDIDFRVNSPEININGDINIPISIKGPTFSLGVNLSVGNGDINFNFGGGGEGGDCCPTTDDPPEDEDDDSLKLIRGVIIRDLVAGDSAYYNEYSGFDEEPLYVPYVGLVRFGRVVNGTTVWTEDIRVKSGNQDVICPFPSGASRYIAEPQDGASWTVKPYYAKVRSSTD